MSETETEVKVPAGSAPSVPVVVSVETKKPWYFGLIDLTERAGATFAQTFLAAITVSESGLTDLPALKIAAVAGAYAVAKFLLVKANAYLKT